MKEQVKNFTLGLDFRKFRLGISADLSDGRLKLYLLAAFFAAGVLLGALSVRNASSPILQSLGQTASMFLEARKTGGFFAIFLRSFLELSLYAALAYFLGLFVFGSFFAPLTMLVKGVSAGLTAGQFYREFGFSGMAVNTVILFPTAVLGTLILILGFRETMGFSNMLLKSAVRDKQISLASNFRIYCLRFLVVLGLLLVPALLDATLSVLFIGSFGV